MRGPAVLWRLSRRLAESARLIGAALTTVSCSDQFGPNPPRPSAEAAEVASPIILVGAGDISSCTNDGDTRTARLVESVLNANPTAWAFVAGDNVYEDGSTAEYRDCYGPTWGRFKNRTRPSLGNHEYDGVEGSKPSFDYFGDELWGNSRSRGGYYSFNLGDSWHIVVLNSNPDFVPTSAGSPQDTWLQADLAANHRPCLAAIWHHPRFYSSQDATSSLQRANVRTFWDRLYAVGADLVLNGHSHNYERFAPQKPDGSLDREKGIREFIVGMGGKGTGVVTTFHPNSEVREGTTRGVIQLTLNASSYTWKFIPEEGKTFADEGTSGCHGSSGGIQTNPPPVASFDFSCTGLTCAFTDLSTDDDAIASRSWKFGDGANASSASPSHTYSAPNSYPVELTVTDEDGATGSITRLVQIGPPPAGGVVLAGAGSIAHCSLASDEATAKLLDALPSATVFTLGDNASSVGSATDFSNCYHPTWGRHKARTRPAVGYMEYKTPGATGYFGYFGAAAGSSPDGYYSYDLGDWHIVALNSMVSMSAGSAQERWLRADLAAHPKVCTLAYIARARFSSGKNGGATSVQPLWQALYERGADIILAGSDHSYERFARQTPAGVANPAGIQQFVVGTGGQALTGLVAPHPNSVVFNGSTFGVLKLTLRATGYSWEFLPVAGSTFSDAGSVDCVGAPAPPPNAAPTAGFTQTCTGLSCQFTDGSADSDGTIKTWSWDFGDGTGSTAASPAHAYAAGRTYTVRLTVTDDDNAASTPATRSVTVTPVPNSVPTAQFDPSCTELDCDFDDSSFDTDGSIVARAWDFGDGTSSTDPSPSHHFSAAGTYRVKLTVTDDDGASQTATRDVTVSLSNVPPTAAFVSSCTHLVCGFTDGSSDSDGNIISRSWDFGDSSPVSSEQHPSHVYEAGGSYTVSLTVTDNASAASTPATETFTLTANLPPTVGFTQVCSNRTCTFTDQSHDDDGTIVDRSWDFGDGASPARAPALAAASTSVSHTYTQDGDYTVVLTVHDDDEAEGIFSDIVPVSKPTNVPPEAGFTATCHKLACAFADGSNDPDGTIMSWSWDFGDGATSAEANPTHAFPPGGPYLVRLVVRDDDSAEHAAEQEVTVVDNIRPQAGFTLDCTYLACSFEDASTDADGSVESRHWDFGDGKTSNSANPTHTYAAAGSYIVSLTVEDDDQAGSEPVSQDLTVEEPPNLPPAADFSASCDNLDCVFSDQSSDADGTITGWSWNFGDGSDASASGSHSYAAGGTYAVALTVTDNDGATHTTSHEVTLVPNLPPDAEFTWSCQKLACSFADGSADRDGAIESRSWDFGDQSTSTQANPAHTFAPGGPYAVKLLVKDDDDAEGTAEHSVTVVGNAPPTAAFSSDCTDLSCSFTDGSTDPDGAVAGWSWEFGDGAVSTEAGPSHHYAAAGSYTVRLTVTDDEHASGGVIHQVTVAEPPNGAPVAAFSRSCNNLACSFSDQSTDPDGSIKTRSWTFGDGGTATGPNPSHTYAGGGSKTVTLTVTDNRDQPSAPASQTFTVAANLAPTVAFTSSCSGLTCSFTNGSSDGDGSIVSRSWNFGDGATSTSNSPSRTYAAGGSYTVRLTVTDDDGATATLTRSITVTAPVTNRLPTALFGSACTRLNCTFTDRSTDPDGNSTIVAWSWTFGDGTGSTARNPTHAFRAGGSYKVKLTVTDNRGGADPITHTVTVTP